MVCAAAHVTFPRSFTGIPGACGLRAIRGQMAFTVAVVTTLRAESTGSSTSDGLIAASGRAISGNVTDFSTVSALAGAVGVGGHRTRRSLSSHHTKRIQPSFPAITAPRVAGKDTVTFKLTFSASLSGQLRCKWPGIPQ
jgi:hypothetical protein